MNGRILNRGGFIETQRRGKVVLIRASLLLALLGLAQFVAAQTAEVYVSSRSGERLVRRPDAQFRAPDRKAVSFRIDPATKQQRIAGFGASFLEAGMVCLNSLAPAAQEEVLQTLFDPVNGAGFSAMKTVIAGTDFMSAGPWYSYEDVPGDVGMKHFSIQRDLGTNGLITFIRRAHKYGRFVLQAPMDYPPDWMLRDAWKDQTVEPKYYDALAHYYLSYLRAYETNGIFIDYLSLFNEPGIYTSISYENIRDLLKNHVGPLLAREAVKTKIQFAEAPNRHVASKEYPVILNDPEARKYVGAIAFHGYSFTDYDKIAALRRQHPALEFWQTEVCYSYWDGITTRSVPLPKLDFSDGDFWGNRIFDDLESGVSAWIYWNMILDENGGPWLVDEKHHNADKNQQHSVVVINRHSGEVTYTGLYYYLAHFSKFVRPGAVRLAVAGGQAGVRCAVFEGPGQKRVAELLNSTAASVPAQVLSEQSTLLLELPPFSITTAVWRRR